MARVYGFYFARTRPLPTRRDINKTKLFIRRSYYYQRAQFLASFIVEIINYPVQYIELLRRTYIDNIHVARAPIYCRMYDIENTLRTHARIEVQTENAPQIFINRI